MSPPASPPIRFRWVLDANVLYAASAENATALVLLMSIQLSDGLGLDEEHRIDGEYEQALTQHPLVRQWFHRMYVDGRCNRYAGNLPSACAKALRKRKFHKNDCKYVAVALQTENRLLVSTNTRAHHFDPTVCRYLRTSHDLEVLCLADACERATAGFGP
jgi:hypothetical protein